MNQHVRVADLLLEEGIAQPSSNHRVPFSEVGTFACKFIIDDDPNENAICCGAPTDGKSWCSYHSRIVFEARPVRVR